MMTNPWKNLGKAINLPERMNFPKRVKHWNLLFIDDHGKVISFRYVRGIFIFFVLVTLALSCISLYLHVLQKNTHKTNNALQKSLEISRQDLVDLKQKNRALMIQLAKAQANTLKKTAQKDPPQAEDKTLARKKAKKAPDTVSAKAGGVKQKDLLSSAQSKPSLKESIEKPEAESSSDSVSKKSPLKQDSSEKKGGGKGPVDIWDFYAFRDAQSDTLNVRFSIKKTTGKSDPVSGYIFVIMKENLTDPKKWAAIPAEVPAEGKPAHMKKGSYFKIRNFKKVKIRSSAVKGPRRFKNATVLVFSPSGELYLEKTYPVVINLPKPPEETSPSEPASSEPDTIQPIRPQPDQGGTRPASSVKEGREIKTDVQESVSEETLQKKAEEGQPIPATP